MNRAYELARHPFLESDYRPVDAAARTVDHLLVDGVVFLYWIDHGLNLVMILEIENTR
jgi:hypothetical protein